MLDGTSSILLAAARREGRLCLLLGVWSPAPCRIGSSICSASTTSLVQGEMLANFFRRAGQRADGDTPKNSERSCRTHIMVFPGFGISLGHYNDYAQLDLLRYWFAETSTMRSRRLLHLSANIRCGLSRPSSSQTKTSSLMTLNVSFARKCIFIARVLS